MANTMRQPIDVDAFTEYVRVNVPTVKLPLSLKQVSEPPAPFDFVACQWH
jgi:hypothetical protein